MSGDTRRSVNGIFLFTLLMNNSMSKRKIKTVAVRGIKHLISRQWCRKGKIKGFPSSGLCIFILHDANLLKEQNRWQHMDFCPTHRSSFCPPKPIMSKWQFPSPSFSILLAFSFGETLHSFARSPFFNLCHYFVFRLLLSKFKLLTSNPTPHFVLFDPNKSQDDAQTYLLIFC